MVSKTTELIKKFSLITLLIGCLGSLYFVIYNGRNNKSIVLVLLFIMWVLSPFIGFMLLIRNLNYESGIIYKATNIFIIFISLASLLLYSGLLLAPGAKLTGFFLIVPLISWFMIVILYWLLKNQNKKFVQNKTLHKT